MGDFGDVAARFRKQRTEAAPTPTARNFAELHLVRARILGVLIRDSRLAAEQSIDELANALGLPAATLTNWELGEETPSLPQLEAVAYLLDVPLSHFWSNKTYSNAEDGHAPPTLPPDYENIRNRVIGVRLALARREAQMSQEEAAAASGLTPQHIAAYEQGLAAIPFPELTSLANAVRKPVSYFVEQGGRIGQWLLLQEEYERFQQLPEEIRAFVSQPVNQPYIEIALRLSKMNNADLRTIAEKILDITF
jgi:transcriptional regulator with XRE-family HTH domain